MSETPAASSLKTQLAVLTTATVVLYLAVMAAVVFVAVIAYRDRTQSHRTNVALCAFRTDLETRIASESITVNHPVDFGISPAALAALRVTVASQQHTVDSLKGLQCH